MKFKVVTMLILAIITLVLSSLTACNSGVDMKQVRSSFSQFMQSAKAKDVDTAWAKCYEPAFLGKGEIEFIIENYHEILFENYDYFIVLDSEGGKIDDFTGLMYPELSDKTAASLGGYLHYTDESKLLFEALLVRIYDDWKIAAFDIPGVDYSSSTSTQSEVPTSSVLIIDDIKLCSDFQDTAHYTVNLNSNYIQGQVIYLLFDIHGVTSNRVNDHYEFNIQISRLALLNDKGEEIADKKDIELNESHLYGDDLLSFPMWLKIGAPLDASSGNYTLELEVTDIFANDSVSTVIPLSINKSPIKINNAHLCSEIDESGHYVLQPNNTYKQGDRVYVYIETPGLSISVIDGQNTIWLKCPKYTVYDPQGVAIVEINNALSEKITYDDPYIAPYMDFYFDISSYSEIGQYSVQIIIEDGWTSDTATETLYFNVEDDGLNQSAIS